MKMLYSFFIILLISIFTVQNTFAQVLKLKTTEVAFREKIDDNWQNWEDWQEASILITIDSDTERIIIYSTKKQTLDIAQYEDESTNDAGETTFSFLCVDQDGYEARIRLIKDKDKICKQLYLNFNKIIVAYNVYRID